jgi:ammonia channel protein AmtB
VKHVMPAALVGLTALITSALVHAGYAIWWLTQSLFRADTASYDWAGALAVSGTATTIVLIAALVVRRLAAGNTPPAETAATPEAIPARVAARRP